MEVIYKDDELLKITSGTYSIHDSTVTRFDIYQQDDQLYIDVYFTSILKNQKILKIHFSDIIKYQFLYTSDHSFYTVESYKFLKTEEGYCLSLDPFDSREEISEQDGDLILCKSIEGVFI